jgi:hypothetical protein
MELSMALDHEYSKLIDTAAATLIDTDRRQSDVAFELLRCRTRDLLQASPDASPEEIIGGVKKFIEDVNRRVEQIRASGGTTTGKA